MEKNVYNLVVNLRIPQFHSGQGFHLKERIFFNDSLMSSWSLKIFEDVTEDDTKSIKVDLCITAIVISDW